MTQLTRKQIEELRQIATRLMDWVDEIDEKPIEVDPEIQKLVESRVDARICLACGQKALDTEQMRRGQDSACYATTRSRIRRGLLTERQLIQQGKLTKDVGTGGRVAKQDMLQVAEDLAAYDKKRAAKKGKT